jgi:[ribosomal protein S5]-alanine N-acetyltransferase
MNMINLESERLTLRALTTEDTGFIIQILNSPGYLRFIADRKIHTKEQAKEYLLSGPLKSYADNGFGLCLVETKKDKTAIGICGLLKRDEWEQPDIGYAFLPEYTGKGYAIEAATTTLTFAFEKLNLECVLATVRTDNQASIRLLEKKGFTFQKFFTYPDRDEKLMLFALLQA